MHSNDVPTVHPRLGRWRVFPDREALAEALVDSLVEAIKATCVGGRSCHLVLPGGRSPVRPLEILAEQDIPWSSLHVYPSDERCVPRDSADRNDRIAIRILVEGGSLPPANLHSIPAEFGPSEGAKRYNSVLNAAPCFDIVVLGVGPDGHIASLFPSIDRSATGSDAIAITNAPAPPAQRVSIGMKRLAAANRKIVIAGGSEKAAVIRDVVLGADLPVTRVQPTDWFLDAGAANNFCIQDHLQPK